MLSLKEYIDSEHLNDFAKNFNINSRWKLKDYILGWLFKILYYPISETLIRKKKLKKFIKICKTVYDFNDNENNCKEFHKVVPNFFFSSPDLTLAYLDLVLDYEKKPGGFMKEPVDLNKRVNTFVLCGKASYLHPIYLNLSDLLLKAIFKFQIYKDFPSQVGELSKSLSKSRTEKMK